MTSMIGKSAPALTLRIGTIVLSLLLLVPAPSHADPLKGGIIGGIGGLVVGGIIGGGGGAAVGAVVGGAGGAMIGSANQNRRQIRRPPAPVRSSAGMAQSSPLVSGIQGALAAKGYNPGSVDGQMGPATAQAISAYQQANGLLVTGQPSQALLDHMRTSGQ